MCSVLTIIDNDRSAYLVVTQWIPRIPCNVCHTSTGSPVQAWRGVVDTGGWRTHWAHGSSLEAHPVKVSVYVLLHVESIEEATVGVGWELLHARLHLLPAASGRTGEGVAPSSVLLQT